MVAFIVYLTSNISSYGMNVPLPLSRLKGTAPDLSFYTIHRKLLERPGDNSFAVELNHSIQYCSCIRKTYSDSFSRFRPAEGSAEVAPRDRIVVPWCFLGMVQLVLLQRVRRYELGSLLTSLAYLYSDTGMVSL